MAIQRGLATAPFADLLWRETAKPDLKDDKQWADAIHAVFPRMMLAYNLSPSWNWDAWGFTDDQIRGFAAELGKMGYVFNFITYGGHQGEALMNGRLARALKEEGVLGFVRLIQRALRLANDPAQYPQSFVGGEWADRFRRAARGPSLTTSSMGGKSTETQHRKAVEVPTSVLERWLRIWTEHWNKLGLYDQGAMSVELKEHWAGAEEMMLNVFDEERDKIAEIADQAEKAERAQEERHRQEQVRLEDELQKREAAERERLKQLEDIRHQREAAEKKRKLEQEKLAQLNDLQKQQVKPKPAPPDLPESDQARTGMAGSDTSLASEYYAAIQNAVTQNWLRPDTAPSGLRCSLRIVQIPGGDVLSADVINPCNADAQTRTSIEQAVKRAAPLPYKGYEKVFSREIKFNFKYDG